MLVTLLTNIYIALSLINSAQSIVYGIITSPDSKLYTIIWWILIDKW